MSSVNTNQKSSENHLKTPVGENNAEKETPVEGNPSEETDTREEDDVEDLFMQMRLAESQGKRSTLLHRVSRDFDEQRLQDVQRIQQEVQQTLQHLMVLRDIPLSSFYGIDLDNLSLPPIQPSSGVGSFYGFDEESLAAENAALDEFYANIRREKAAREKDQSSGVKCSQDQSQFYLLPSSKSEEDDDFLTLRVLLKYKLHYGSLPNIIDRQATTFGLNLNHLLVYVNHQLKIRISESLLTDKLVKLQTKYKKLVAEKGKNPEHQDFCTPGDYIFFQLANMTWEQRI
ncbi:hypothetical protein AgCh_008960 [Apium graveolens]